MIKFPKAKSKPLDFAASDVKSGELLEPDVLQDLVHKIENMKEKQTLDLIAVLMDQTEVAFFKLGGLLSLVQANGWYAPHASFREFVENVHGLAYRKAMYWIKIYNDLANSGIPWSKVSILGWSKLRLISGVMTPDNVDHWVALAKKQTFVQLIESVDAEKTKDDAPLAKVATMTIKVYSDQKETIEAAIVKGKAESGAAFVTDALVFALKEYLGGMTLRQRMGAVGFEKALEDLNAEFPAYDIAVSLAEVAA